MGNPVSVARQIDLLEGAVEANPPLAFDVAKSLIESVCKTILTDRAVTFDETAKLPDLVRITLDAVRITDDGLPRALGRSMKALGNGIVTVAQRLGELRNKGGLIGHGRGAQEEFVDETHALYAARAADSLVHLLYVAHEKEVNTAAPGPSYGDHDVFDIDTDDRHAVLVRGIPFRASEVLFRLDPIAYLEELNVFESDRAMAELDDPKAALWQIIATIATGQAHPSHQDAPVEGASQDALST